MKNLYTLLAVLLFAAFAVAQPSQKTRCYSYEHLQDQIKQDPERGRKLDALDKMVDDMVSARENAANGNSTAKGKPGGGGGGGGTRSIVYVPVVVHVLWNTNDQNISDVQVQSQIDVLNQDYSKKNVEIKDPNSIWQGYKSTVADCQIQFCLYQVIHKHTATQSFSTNDAMKKSSQGGDDAVNPTTMLNFWSCNLGGGLLGYAQFPGGNASTDGVVILYSSVGNPAGGATEANYDLGRTATHEIGHWFGLRHIWGDRRCGDDYVGDTPLHDAANYGCPGDGHRSLCKGTPLEMWMNYMDYTYDKCMYMFTSGQKTRMDGYISASRAPYCLASCPNPVAKKSLLNGKTLTTTWFSNELTVYPTITSGQTNILIPSNKNGISEITILSQSGNVLKRQRLNVMEGSSSHALQLSELPNGLYLIRVATPDGTLATRKVIVQH